MHKRKAPKGFSSLYRNFGASADIVIGVIGVVVVAIDLAIARVEVEVRDITIGIARTHIV